MNVILVMVDSLNRTYLSPYGNEWIRTPNFERLAQRCVTVEGHWTGSLPTMPTRHEVMAGRHEYLWRPWGPLEPFDVTLAQLCRGKGQVAMLLTDTYHYFQEGSGNYHMDFTGWEFLRGHEPDLLFDLELGHDVTQDVHGEHPDVVERLTKLLVAELERLQAPQEQFQRLGLTPGA